MTDPNAIKAFIFGGKAIFTLRSVETGAHYTYKVSEGNKRNPNDPKEVPCYFVKVLTGPDNSSDYAYLGTIFERSNFRLTAKSKMAKTPVIAFDWSFRSILSGKIPATLEFWHEGRCGRCGRVLTVPESIATGFGPDCAGMQVALPIAGGLNHTKAAADALRYTRIKKFHDSCNDFGDAKYLALAEEAGITIEDLRWFSKHQKNDSDYAVPQPEHYVDAVVERAVAKYKNNFPEDYYQDGSLTETEAHAIAVKKFQKELTGAIS